MTEAKTFLVVENDPVDSEFIRNQFNTVLGDFHVQIVEDGFEAMKYMMGACKYFDRERYPLPEVILLDVQWPRLDGLLFLEWLRTGASVPKRFVPVIVVSGSRSPDHVSRAYLLGANAYLFKPVN